MNQLKPLLLASAALLAPPAWAQGAGEDVDIVVVASGVEQPASEAGRSVTLITQEEIARSQTVVLADLLANGPGVVVTRNGGIGTLTTVRIRGAEGEQTLVLIDGVRVNDPSSPGGGFDFANLLAGAVSRVEVLRGPNSVVWGSQAIGGVVNVVTEGGGPGLAARGNAEYGFADTLFANAALSAGNDKVSGGVTAGYYRTDGISALASGTEPDGYRQYGASAKLKVAFAPGLALDLRGYYADSRTEIDGYMSVFPYSAIDTAEYSTARELYGYAGLVADLFGDRLHNRVAVTLADIDRDNYDPAFGTAPSFFGRGNSERYEYRGDFAISPAVRAVFGAEHEDSRFTDGSTTAATGTTSGYGELILSPVEMLSLTGGVRYDDHDDFGEHTSFGLSAALRPAGGTALRASYGDGFKAPTLYQLYSFYGTPTLRPESAESYELGIEQQLAGVLTLGAAWFRRDTVNQIDFDLGTFTYANIARARASGVELEARVRLFEGLRLRGAYTHVVSENRSPGANLGNDLARRPRDTASLSADYEFGFGLNLGGTLRVAGGSFDDPGNFTRLDGYALLGLRAEMPVNDRLSVYARVDNVWDEQYETVAGYGTLGRAAYGGVRVKLD